MIAIWLLFVKQTLSEALKFTKLNDLEKNKIIANIEKDRKNLPSGKSNCDQNDIIITKPREIIPCSKNTNPQVPAFQDSVRIEYDEVRGRYGVATRDLMPGEVILQVCWLLIPLQLFIGLFYQESPVAMMLKPGLGSDYCDTCWTRVSGLTAVPCPRCCSVVYCSASCRSESQSGWHQYECCQNIADTWCRVNDQILEGQKEITLTYHQLCYR